MFVNKPVNFSDRMRDLALSVSGSEYVFESDTIQLSELWIYPSAPHRYVVNLLIPFGEEWRGDGMWVEVRYARDGHGRKFIPHKSYRIGIQTKHILTLQSFTQWLEELIPTLRFNG